MKPLSEESLREKIVEILKEQEVVLHNASVDLAKKGIIPRPKAAILNDTATKIVALQLQERQAYGEQLLESYAAEADKEYDWSEVDNWTFSFGSLIRSDLITQRQRNTSGRKTD